MSNNIPTWIIKRERWIRNYNGCFLNLFNYTHTHVKINKKKRFLNKLKKKKKKQELVIERWSRNGFDFLGRNMKLKIERIEILWSFKERRWQKVQFPSWRTRFLGRRRTDHGGLQAGGGGGGGETFFFFFFLCFIFGNDELKGR